MYPPIQIKLRRHRKAAALSLNKPEKAGFRNALCIFEINEALDKNRQKFSSKSFFEQFS
jgi:hypothetical protein